jgi:predicted ester cyclase
VALQNYAKNIPSAFGELEFTIVDVVEGADALAVRSRAEGTHIGTFLGLAPTGRRIAWDNVAIVHVDAGKVAGQWIQADLWGMYQQLTASEPEPPRIARAESALAWAQSAR